MPSARTPEDGFFSVASRLLSAARSALKAAAIQLNFDGRIALKALVLSLSVFPLSAGANTQDESLPSPIQTKLDSPKTYMLADYDLTAVAFFKVNGRVLSVARYKNGREARVSPIDLALGWGRMSSDLVSRVQVSQVGRFATVSYQQNAGIKLEDVVHNSSNIHMIPSSSSVRAQLRNVKEGQVVQIEGYLVDVRHRDGWRWRTSTTRTDHGDGACEILLVKSFRVMN